jgi:hypothetical protein
MVKIYLTLIKYIFISNNNFKRNFLNKNRFIYFPFFFSLKKFNNFIGLRKLRMLRSIK